MTTAVSENPASFETRLAAVESAVARLSAIVEPEFAVNNIAAPVAVPVVKQAAQHQFSARFFAMLDTGESVLKYSAAIAFAAVDANSPLADEINEAFKSPPSLGKWTELLRKVLDSQLTSWPMDVLRPAFRKANGKATPTARYLLDEFISLRNDVRGHGSQQPEGYYEELYLKNHLIVQDCINACKHLHLPLISIHAVDHQNEQYAYKVTLLMGAAAKSLSEPIVSTTKRPVGATCLWDHAAQLLLLRDFVSHRYCTICASEHVFFADRITAEKIYLHSYFGNHRIEAERKAE
jgi:hypothetical protein